MLKTILMNKKVFLGACNVIVSIVTLIILYLYIQA